MKQLHICTTGQLFSFREEGAPLDKRDAVFSGFRYGAAPEAALITFGIQGEGYFEGLRDNFHKVMEGCYCMMGYVWLRHVPIYQRLARTTKIAQVDVLWTGKPYGDDGPEFAWIICRKLDEQGNIIGPRAKWD